jgi:hypothetical protein
MKTRIFQTRFYKDRDVLSLSLHAQHLFMYLLTCEQINICGVFELPDPYIVFESKLTQEQLDLAKKELEDTKKVVFKDSWIFVVNARKNNNYEKSPDNYTAMLKEMGRIPEDICKHFNKYSPYTRIDTSMYSSVDSSVHSSLDSTKKQEIRNKKQETRTHKSEKEDDLPFDWKEKGLRSTKELFNRYGK